MTRFRFTLALILMIAGTLALATGGDLEARSYDVTTLVSPVYLPMLFKPAATPIPTPVPTPGAGYSLTFPESPASILGTCPASVHDRYFTLGPDGQKYRTWHPVTVPINASNPNGPKCSFAHEHGDPPHPDGPLPPFGYISYVAGSYGMIAAHPGYKVFTHYRDGRNGYGRPELDYGPGLAIDFTAALHQGTSGAGRLTIEFHDFWFWSRDAQGRETLVTGQADTGMARNKAGGDGGSDCCDRFIVSHSAHTYETWGFNLNVGGAWNTGGAFMAVTNPMNHAHGSLATCHDGACDGVELVATSEEICGPNFGPCSQKLPFGDRQSLWLGHFRTIHEPDWTWRNAGQSQTFCTDPYGARQVCGLSNSVQQRVAAVTVSNSGARILDRTPNSSGWDSYMNLPVGAPGGN